MTNPHVKESAGVGTTCPSLLHRIKAMEPAAWERFVVLYGPLVYQWCRRSGLQEADAADVGQDVFRAVFRTVATFRHDRPSDSFRGWLWTITRRKIIDVARRRDASPGDGVGGSEMLTLVQSLPDEDTDPTASDPLVGRGLFGRAVELILGECREEIRQAFLRVVVDGQRPDVVAESLGLKVNVVYLAKSRILKRMREEFAGLLPAELLSASAPRLRTT
ncbi:RNA polymerase sigma factor [Fimbriiglobus ruber]|uniref:Transcriptional control n=1 Tax=Fimbriiglobus ruber TaxID=1908690 RepID=A0A225DFA8_9BACT|nr:sigma-70 family RNA polymerase sigma factor [Fimbriiglobus ruber]OWK38334.1 transcriptional control [Fimbriiglobus ruber]